MRWQSASPGWTTLVVGAVTGTDLLTKTWAAPHVASAAASRRPRPWLSLDLVRNPGMSLGIGAGHPILVVLLAAGATAFVAVRLGRASTPMQRVSLAVVLGGALANLLERLARGSVTDWIRLAWYPNSFNLADLAIRLGLVVVVAAYVLSAHAHHRAVELRPSAGNRPTSADSALAWTHTRRWSCGLRRSFARLRTGPGYR